MGRDRSKKIISDDAPIQADIAARNEMIESNLRRKITKLFKNQWIDFYQFERK